MNCTIDSLLLRKDLDWTHNILKLDIEGFRSNIQIFWSEGFRSKIRFDAGFTVSPTIFLFLTLFARLEEETNEHFGYIELKHLKHYHQSKMGKSNKTKSFLRVSAWRFFLKSLFSILTGAAVMLHKLAIFFVATQLLYFKRCMFSVSIYMYNYIVHWEGDKKLLNVASFLPCCFSSEKKFESLHWQWCCHIDLLSWWD